MTHLELLQLATERAAANGIFATKVPGNRALLAVDLHGVIKQGWTPKEFTERVGRQWNAARRRARSRTSPPTSTRLRGRRRD